LLWLFGVKKRLGFGRVGSRTLLSQNLQRPPLLAHRYENWRAVGRALGLPLPAQDQVAGKGASDGQTVLVHSGAGLPLRVWPLERTRTIVERLRQLHYSVQVACDLSQEAWWRTRGETAVAAPKNLTELLSLLDQARIFIGNDSGPGHLAALCGLPTFTIFGPQLPESFAPLHPAAQWVPGRACPYKPCFDNCRYAQPNCLLEVSEAEVWERVILFINQHVSAPTPTVL
jgi:heptosyltransferase-2